MHHISRVNWSLYFVVTYCVCVCVCVCVCHNFGLHADDSRGVCANPHRHEWMTIFMSHTPKPTTVDMENMNRPQSIWAEVENVFVWLISVKMWKYTKQIARRKTLKMTQEPVTYVPFINRYVYMHSWVELLGQQWKHGQLYSAVLFISTLLFLVQIWCMLPLGLTGFLFSSRISSTNLCCSSSGSKTPWGLQAHLRQIHAGAIWLPIA